MAQRIRDVNVKRLVTYLVVIVVLLGAAGILGVLIEHDNTSGKSEEGQSAQLLFTVDARASQIVESPADPNQELLVLYGVDPAAVWFTDRPNRESGLMPLTDLMADWRSLGFVADPPNAAVGFHDGSRAVVELTSPRYDPASAVWMATVDFLPGSPSSSIARNENLGAAHLFIDDAELDISSLVSGGVDPASVISSAPNDSYTFPPTALISNFSDHHLDYIQDGVTLVGQDTQSQP
jgi:hypothetical protein